MRGGVGGGGVELTGGGGGAGGLVDEGAADGTCGSRERGMGSVRFGPRFTRRRGAHLHHTQESSVEKGVRQQEGVNSLSHSPSGRRLSEAMRRAWLIAMSRHAGLPPGSEAAQVMRPMVAAAPSVAVKTARGLMEAAPAARASAEISAVRRTLKTPERRGQAGGGG